MPATEQKDYYKILGLGRKASADDIRKSYRRLARKYHPDVNPGDKAAEERFKNVQEAYDILKDPKKRQMYDQFGFYSDQGPFARANQGGHPGQFDFGGFDFTDYFSREGGPQAGGPHPGGQKGGNWGGFGDLFSQFFRPGAQGAGARAPQQGGEDLEYTVDIGFWEAIQGTSVRLNIGRYEICAQCNGVGNRAAGQAACPECQGTGHVTQTVGAMKFNLSCPRCQGRGQLRNVCPGCGGNGRINRSEQVEVRIPAGAQDGSRLRVAGKGNAGSGGGPAGDLYIVTRVGSHPLFERKGDDIRIRVPITIAEAILGAKIEVPTIDGRALLKIPPATDSGKTFRLREKGVLNRRTSRRGDQLVEVKIVVPPVPDESSKQMVRDFAKLNSEDPRKDIWNQL